MVAPDNTLSLLDEPLRTLRLRGPSHNYNPGELAMAIDVMFPGDGIARARNGFGLAVASMTDLTVAAADLTGTALGYARPSSSRIFGLLCKCAGGGLTGAFYSLAASPVQLRTWATATEAGALIGDFASVGNLGLYTTCASYDPDASSSIDNLGCWYGGMQVAAYSTGTVTATRGSTAVTGAGTTFTAAMAGGWLTDSAGTTLIGRIASVQGGTNLTLERPALAALAGVAYKIIPVRNMLVRMAKGRITCSTGSAIVTGARTKFISGRNTAFAGTWDLFRAYDYAFIGTVTSFDSDLQVTLVANAAVAMANERYIAIPRAITNALDSENGSQQKNVFRATMGGGAITEEHQGRLYMANRSNGLRTVGGAALWFSEDIDYEAFDLSEADGDYIIVGRASQAITGMVSMTQGLAIFKAGELWMLYGDDPVNYQLRKVADVGTPDGRSIAVYHGGLLFVSAQGVMLFDGTTIRNLTQNLIHDAAFAAATNLAVNTFPIIGMLANGYYIFSIVNLSISGVNNNVNGTDRTLLTYLAGVLNIQEGSLSLFSNLQPTTACQLPSDATTSGETYWAGRDGSADQKVNVFNASGMVTGLPSASSKATFGGPFGGGFAYTARNDYWAGCGISQTASQYTVGPHPYIHTRRLSLAPDRLTYWKDVLVEYASDDSTVSLESVYGDALDPTYKVEGTLVAGGTLDTAGTVERSIQKRAMLRHRSSYLSLRVYPTSDPLPLTGGNSSFAILGLSFLCRPMRRTRT